MREKFYAILTFMPLLITICNYLRSTYLHVLKESVYCQINLGFRSRMGAYL
jgi:hypothetical protein